MKSIFRKASLERLSSPDQLDKTIVITSPLSWLAVISLAVIIILFIIWSVFGRLPVTVNTNGIIVNGKDAIAIHSPFGGQLVESDMLIGRHIKAGDRIGAIKDQGGEASEVFATQSGVVTNIPFSEESEIKKYDTIARLSPEDGMGDVLVAYLPVDSGKLLQAGMRAIVTPFSLDAQKYGHMEAEIISIGDYMASESDIQNTVGSNSGADKLFSADYPVVPVVLKLKEDRETASGYYWSAAKGRELDISAGTVTDIKIIISESAPISKLLPVFDTEEG